MTVTIENQFLTAEFLEKGAELCHLVSKDSGFDYIWQADPQYWGRHAPVLFPFVGRLKDDQYQYEGKTYQMGQHGFARDCDFTVTAQTTNAVTFNLKDSPITRVNYPFAFSLDITYTLKDSQLTVAYHVANPAVKPLYFSIGGHPGFNVPMSAELSFEDYYLSYEPKKTRVQVPLAGPYSDLAHKTLAPTDTDLDLTHELFKNDAMIYELHHQNRFTLKSEKNYRAISLIVEDAPYVGIWSAYPKQAPYVCIEPWWGIADRVDSTGELTQKTGINRLNAGETFDRHYMIQVHQRRAF